MKLYKSDLNKAKGFIQMLEQDITDTDNLIGKINQFSSVIGANRDLQGLGYNAVKNKLTEYITLLDKRKNAAITLKTAIDSALNTMSDYMGGYVYLSTDMIELAKSEIERLKGLLWEYDYFTNSAGKTIKKKVKNHGVESQINNLYKWIEYLERMEPTDKYAWINVSTTEYVIQSLSSMVSSMQSIDISGIEKFPPEGVSMGEQN